MILGFFLIFINNTQSWEGVAQQPTVPLSINNTQSWEGVVQQPTVSLFLSEFLLLHFLWPVSPYYSGKSNVLGKIDTDFKVQGLPLMLLQSLLVYEVEWSLWTWPFFHLCQSKSGGFLILRELLFDIQVYCYDFYIAL